jgi:hypothetical protein
VAILPPLSLTPEANFPPVSLIPVMHLDLWISPQIFKKIRNGLDGILKKLIHEKTRSKKSRDTIPLTEVPEYGPWTHGHTKTDTMQLLPINFDPHDLKMILETFKVSLQ